MKVMDWVIENFDADEGNGVLCADGFEDALIGVAWGCGRGNIAIYDYDLAVKVLVDRDGMEEDEAIEFIDFNVTGGFVGHDAPLFMMKPPGDDYDYAIHFDPKDLIDQVELDELEKEAKCPTVKDQDPLTT